MDERTLPSTARRGRSPAIPIRVIHPLPRAVDHAVTMAPYGTLIVTGSIHTVGDTMHHRGVEPFPADASNQPG